MSNIEMQKQEDIIYSYCIEHGSDFNLFLDKCCKHTRTHLEYQKHTIELWKVKILVWKKHCN